METAANVRIVIIISWHHSPSPMISTVAQYVTIPVIAGGGFNTREDVVRGVEAGASIVVQGTYVEENALKDKGAGLKRIIEGLKAAGAKRV